jgi:hypothetical protein
VLDDGMPGAPAPPPTAVPADSTDALTGVDAGFVISTLPKMPVRDQGRRGTCASFAGIGQLESFLLKKYPQLPSLDLAEQYFYYASKTDQCLGDHVPLGCSLQEEGSRDSDGYQASITGMSFDIPDEASCPYQNQRGDNDIQYQDVQSQCLPATPIARVTAVSMVMTAQEILDYLKTKDVAVAIDSTLSCNWRHNSGFVTLAGAGDTSCEKDGHTAGHAYLVVGARPIDPSMGEGNMCFLVKNSWGDWGLEGLSCVTLAWFNQYRRPHAFTVVDDAELSPEYLAQFASTPAAPAPGPLPDPPPPPQPMPAAGPPETPLRTVLEGDNGSWSVMEVRSTGGAGVAVRGILADGTPTNELALERQQDALSFEGVEVGRLYLDQMQLCTAKFSALCQLSYLPADGGLKIEFMQHARQSAMLERTLGSSQGVQWQELFALTRSYGLQMASTSAGLGLRLVDGNKTPVGKPLGLQIDLRSGEIISGGMSVGAIGTGGVDLCTGAFKNSCRLVVGGDRLLNLFVRR